MCSIRNTLVRSDTVIPVPKKNSIGLTGGSKYTDAIVDINGHCCGPPAFVWEQDMVETSRPIERQGKEGQKLVLQSRCFFFSARPPLFWAFRLLSRERHRVALVVAC